MNNAVSSIVLSCNLIHTTAIWGGRSNFNEGQSGADVPQPMVQLRIIMMVNRLTLCLGIDMYLSLTRVSFWRVEGHLII